MGDVPPSHQHLNNCKIQSVGWWVTHSSVQSCITLCTLTYFCKVQDGQDIQEDGQKSEQDGQNSHNDGKNSHQDG